ncbi:dephospho-CoA kinase [Geomicrobium sp. JSM 1781026]|uniref:dephospho-CoA kinase n=1 Tax=Geomicrobium sp. JSM 1781026 TaxID=3344580 RepID=UPI0035C18C11
MIIGLTGGIASGKSFIAELLQRNGLPIIDADQIAKKIVEPGEKAHALIKERFGNGVFHDDDTLHRKKLGVIIFNDEKERQALNDIMHPLIQEESTRQQRDYEEKGHRTIVYDIPLLVENNRMDSVDQVLLVFVDEKTQLERLMERDNSSEEEAKSRIASQIPLDEKKKYADEIVDNSGSRLDSEKQVEKILKKWNVCS